MAGSISRREFVSIGATLAIGSLATAGCGSTTSPQAVVLFVTLELGNPFYMEMMRGLDAAIGNAPGWTVEKRAGRRPDDASGQRELIEAYLTRFAGANPGQLVGLVLVPANSRLELTDVIRSYNAARVPVINVDIPIEEQALQHSGAQVNSFIGSDNVAGGRAAAEEMARHLPTGGRLLILMGVPGQANTRARRDGFMTGLDLLAQRTGTRFEAREWTANWSMSEALVATDSIISSGTQVDGIFAENDLMALGAAQAVDGANWSGRRKPIIIGYDAIPDAVNAVREGRIHATVSQEPAVMGRKAIEYLIRLDRGETVPQREIVPVRVISLRAPHR